MECKGSEGTVTEPRGLGSSLILGVLRLDLRGLKETNSEFRLRLSPWDVWIGLKSFLSSDCLIYCNWYVYRSL